MKIYSSSLALFGVSAVWLLLMAAQKPARPDSFRPSVVMLDGRLVNPAKPDKVDPYWKKALHEVSAPQLSSIVEPAKSGQPATLTHGNRSEKVIALTFDDGPHPVMTAKLLALLKKENVKATFFVVGKMVKKNPDLLKQIIADGNEVGNHTFSHATLTKLPFVQVRAEYEACNEIVKDVAGYQMHVCRPPGGDCDEDVIKAATDQGLTTVLWTDDPGDYANPGTGIIEKKTLRRLSRGGIILLHDGVQETLDILPQIIDYARKRGYRFVTVDELEDTKLSSDRRQNYRSSSRSDSLARQMHR